MADVNEKVCHLEDQLRHLSQRSCTPPYAAEISRLTHSQMEKRRDTLLYMSSDEEDMMTLNNKDSSPGLQFKFIL